MSSAAAGIQSSAPAKVDPALANVKGHDYYTDTFVPPSEEVTEIDPRDKVSAGESCQGWESVGTAGCVPFQCCLLRAESS